MNLWAKRAGQLALLSVALFFFSCQEDIRNLGYRNPNSKFKVSFVEIPLESSVLLRDSLRTSNFAYFGEVNRFLVGSYNDAVFGNTTASAFTQFFTTTSGKLPAAAVYDSVVLQLRFDLYNYGASTVTPQSISIYEINKDLIYDSLVNYFNKTNVAAPTLLGSKSFTINPAIFNEHAATSADADTTVILVRIPLNNTFGQRIFNNAVTFRDGTSTADSAYVKYSEFIKEFKGLAFKADNMDKVVGFNPLAEQSRLFVHYHEQGTDRDSLVLPLGFSTAVSFNQIKTDRSATELSALNQYYQESLQSNDKRYVQAGTGVVTKLDFSNFYSFADTVDNILINSAEFVMESVETSPLAPPTALSMRVLTDSNRPKVMKTHQDSLDVSLYNGYVSSDFASSAGNGQAALVDGDHALYASGDFSPLIPYSSSRKAYSAVFSLFLQQLALKNEAKPRFKYFGLYPASQSTSVPGGQSSAKGINRAVFPKDKIKLRIYYTKPTAEQ